MEVSGIGGGMAGAGAVGMTAGTTAGATGAGTQGATGAAESAATTTQGPRSDPNAAPPIEPNSAGQIPAHLQNLVEMMQDFSSAEILMALMLMKALGGDDEEEKCGGGGAGLALMAGMALAGQMGGMFGNQQSSTVPGIDGAGGVGTGFDAMA